MNHNSSPHPSFTTSIANQDIDYLNKKGEIPHFCGTPLWTGVSFSLSILITVLILITKRRRKKLLSKLFQLNEKYSTEALLYKRCPRMKSGGGIWYSPSAFTAAVLSHRASNYRKLHFELHCYEYQDPGLTQTVVKMLHFKIKTDGSFSMQACV